MFLSFLNVIVNTVVEKESVTFEIGVPHVAGKRDRFICCGGEGKRQKEGRIRATVYISGVWERTGGGREEDRMPCWDEVDLEGREGRSGEVNSLDGG